MHCSESSLRGLQGHQAQTALVHPRSVRLPALCADNVLDFRLQSYGPSSHEMDHERSQERGKLAALTSCLGGMRFATQSGVPGRTCVSVTGPPFGDALGKIPLHRVKVLNTHLTRNV